MERLAHSKNEMSVPETVRREFDVGEGALEAEGDKFDLRESWLVK